MQTVNSVSDLIDLCNDPAALRRSASAPIAPSEAEEAAKARVRMEKLRNRSPP